MEAFFAQLFRLPLRTSEKGLCVKLAKNVFVWNYVKMCEREKEAMSVSKRERVRLRRRIQ